MNADRSPTLVLFRTFPTYDSSGFFSGSSTHDIFRLTPASVEGRVFDDQKTAFPLLSTTLT